MTTQWMDGSILVAPVLKENSTHVPRPKIRTAWSFEQHDVHVGNEGKNEGHQANWKLKCQHMIYCTIVIHMMIYVYIYIYTIYVCVIFMYLYIYIYNFCTISAAICVYIPLRWLDRQCQVHFASVFRRKQYTYIYI